MLTFVGDVYLKNPVAIDVPLDGVLVVNLEAPLTDRSIGYPGKINLRAEASNFSHTFGSRSVVVNLANNHLMDFLEGGLEDTLTYLEQRSTSYFGLVRRGGQSVNPAMVEVDGLTCALLGYADVSSTPVFATGLHSGAAELTLEQVTRDIHAARESGAERIVVNVHWGEEQVWLPSPRCVRLARDLVDAGADMVIGHHAHCVQAFEVYHDKHIFYGLGNFIFPAHQSPSYFANNGEPTRRVDSRPSPRNRRSLAVTWQPRTGKVHVQPTYFTDATVQRGSFDVRRYKVPLDLGEAYERRYHRAFSWGKIQHSFERFQQDPKFPGLRHLRGLSRLMRQTPNT